MPELNPMNIKAFFKTMALIHAALCMGLLIFTIIAYFLNQSFEAVMDTSDVFIYLVPIVSVSGYFLSQFIFQKQLQAIDSNDTLANKLSKYNTASLIKYVLIEGPAFIALAGYFMNGNAMYLVIAFALILYLYTQRPKVHKIIQELPLSYEEKKEFDILKT